MGEFGDKWGGSIVVASAGAASGIFALFAANRAKEK